MKLYHWTSEKSANVIEAEGFVDHPYRHTSEVKANGWFVSSIGVWFSIHKNFRSIADRNELERYKVLLECDFKIPFVILEKFVTPILPHELGESIRNGSQSSEQISDFLDWTPFTEWKTLNVEPELFLPAGIVNHYSSTRRLTTEEIN